MPNTILTAIDALQHRNTIISRQVLSELKNKRCGLVTNQTGLTRNRQPTLAVLEISGINIEKVFSPEHGFQGVFEGKVGDTKLQGRSILSLYGEHRKPTAEMLSGLDVLIFDIQDIGARFYTYSSTMALCLEACGENNIALLVLDRPNPLGGTRIEGPYIDEDLRSFVGHMRIPVTHGLTMGELARWHRADQNIVVDLRVLQCPDWQRSQTWHELTRNETQREWIAPSPNIPDFESARWYPGSCLWEFFDVSVGRGTDWPFQVVGAPWMEAAPLARALDATQAFLPDFTWQTVSFVPTRATHKGELCHGLRFTSSIKDARFAPVDLGLAVIGALHQSHAERFTGAEAEKCLSLLGSRSVLNSVLENDVSAAVEQAHADARDWRMKRQSILLYQ